MAGGSLWLQVAVVAHVVAVFTHQVADKILVLTVGWHRRVIGRGAASPGAGNWLLPLLLLLCRLLPCCPLMNTCHYLSFSFILTSSSLLISATVKLKVCRIKIWNVAAKHPPHSGSTFVAAEVTWETRTGLESGEDVKRKIFSLSATHANVKAVSGDGKTSFGFLLYLKCYLWPIWLVTFSVNIQILGRHFISPAAFVSTFLFLCNLMLFAVNSFIFQLLSWLTNFNVDFHSINYDCTTTESCHTYLPVGL